MDCQRERCGPRGCQIKIPLYLKEKPLGGEFGVLMSSLLLVTLKGRVRLTSPLDGSLFPGEPNHNKTKLWRNVNHLLKAAGFSCSPTAQVALSESTCFSLNSIVEEKIIVGTAWWFLVGYLLYCFTWKRIELFATISFAPSSLKVTEINKTTFQSRYMQLLLKVWGKGGLGEFLFQISSLYSHTSENVETHIYFGVYL